MTDRYSLPHEWPLYLVIAASAALAAVSIYHDRHTIWPPHAAVTQFDI